MKLLHAHKKFSAPFGAVLLLILGNIACQAAAGLFSSSTPTIPPPTETVIPISPSPTVTSPPTATASPTESSSPVSTPTQTNETPGCENILAMRLLDLPEQTKDLFEHHAKGTFLILHLEVINLTQTPIQIYSDDYTLILPQDNSAIQLKPHAAATNYLYLVRGDSFYQDQIKAAGIWRTYLAFDIPPNTTHWELRVTPGAGNSPPLCQTTISP